MIKRLHPQIKLTRTLTGRLARAVGDVHRIGTAAEGAMSIPSFIAGFLVAAISIWYHRWLRGQ
jgi:hypothetical protein